MHLGSADALGAAAAVGDFRIGFLVLGRQPAGFSEGDLAAELALELVVHGLHGHRHIVDDHALLRGSDVLEAGWPSFEGLEDEGERILTWSQALAAVDIGLVLGEHVPGLEVGHLKVSVGRGLDVLRPVVVAAVFLGLHIGHVDFLLGTACTLVLLSKSS